MRVDEIDVELVLDGRAEVGEGAIWDASQGRVVWVDIPAGLVHSLDPTTTTDETMTVGQPVGAVALRVGGGLVLALRDGFAVLEDDTVRMLATVEAHRSDNRMNDGNVDAAGRLWAGTMQLDMRPNAGALYRLDPDHTVRQMVAPMSVPNGIDWSLDGGTMYIVDSGTSGVDSYVFDCESGEISRRRPVCDVPTSQGLPDGLTVDAEGFLWVAIWGAGAVHRYAPDGRLAAVVRVPVSQVTSCTFGGARLDTLYITTAAEGVGDREAHAGGVFAAKPAATGRLPNQYRG